MTDPDEAVVTLSVAVLRGSEHEIEALSLEALAADAGPGGLDGALEDAARSERRGGAFGMEIVGALLVPVLVEAAQKFWASYAKELATKLGANAADVTIAKLKSWLRNAPPIEQKQMSERLADAIRTVSVARGLKAEDVDALIAATAPDRLGPALAGG